eukprot:TRINITY_DN14431_c0_g1_i1.p1 TRINITY_DN14431_c0_g1~~TRINITY_DN14431_c0_g1_i1.p1  ORF type:complete len:690 (+),score=184.20 TRINITY_DN14431_c0_g1_i1:70-2139(+)
MLRPPVGSDVVIVGLADRPELNGQEGGVVAHQEDGGVVVELKDGQVAVPAGSLRITGQEELRIDSDGCAYDREDFALHYGAEWQARWDQAERLQPDVASAAEAMSQSTAQHASVLSQQQPAGSMPPPPASQRSQAAAHAAAVDTLFGPPPPPVTDQPPPSVTVVPPSVGPASSRASGRLKSVEIAAPPQSVPASSHGSPQRLQVPASVPSVGAQRQPHSASLSTVTAPAEPAVASEPAQRPAANAYRSGWAAGLSAPPQAAAPPAPAPASIAAPPSTAPVSVVQTSGAPASATAFVAPASPASVAPDPALARVPAAAVPGLMPMSVIPAAGVPASVAGAPAPRPRNTTSFSRPSSPMSEITDGSLVVAHSLRRHTELNGRTGKVAAHKRDGSIVVDFGGRVVSVRPRNLVPAPPTALDAHMQPVAHDASVAAFEARRHSGSVSSVSAPSDVAAEAMASRCAELQEQIHSQRSQLQSQCALLLAQQSQIDEQRRQLSHMAEQMSAMSQGSNHSPLLPSPVSPRVGAQLQGSSPSPLLALPASPRVGAGQPLYAPPPAAFTRHPHSPPQAQPAPPRPDPAQLYSAPRQHRQQPPRLCTAPVGPVMSATAGVQRRAVSPPRPRVVQPLPCFLQQQPRQQPPSPPPLPSAQSPQFAPPPQPPAPPPAPWPAHNSRNSDVWRVFCPQSEVETAM